MMMKAMIQMRKITACPQCDYAMPTEGPAWFCSLKEQVIEEDGLTVDKDKFDFSDRVPTWCPLPDWGQPLVTK